MALGKFDYLKFRNSDYISSCGPNTKCRMCFDIIKAREFTLQELDWKTHIANVETKTKDYSGFVENLQLKRRYLKEFNEITRVQSNKLSQDRFIKYRFEYFRDTFVYLTKLNENIFFGKS